MATTTTTKTQSPTATDETLRNQFQILQDQQKRKLSRLKQGNRRQGEWPGLSSATSGGGNATYRQGTATTTTTTDSDDDLGLEVPDVPKNDFVPPETLVLQDRIREIKDENGRLYKLLGERDYEIKRLKKRLQDDAIAITGGAGGDTAASKIVELSKKIRELNCDLQSEQMKVKQLTRHLQERDSHQLQSNSASNTSTNSTTSLSTPASVTRNISENNNTTLSSINTSQPQEFKSLQEKQSKWDSKILDLKQQNQILKQEMKLANKVIASECGEGVTVQDLLQNNTTWRGRQQQIVTLQNKLSELRTQLELYRPAPSVEEQFLHVKESTLAERDRARVKKIEREHRETQEKLSGDVSRLGDENTRLKQQLEGARARCKVLSNETKSLKSHVETLMKKNTHDDELISALMKQQGQIKQMLVDNVQLQDEQRTRQQEEHQQQLNRSQSEGSVVEQLKNLATEKEAKIRNLEHEINSLRTQIQRPNTVQPIQNTPQSLTGHRTIPKSAPPVKRDSLDKLTGGESEQSAPQVDESETATSSADCDDVRRRYHEVETMFKAAEVERDKMMELCQILQNRVDEALAKVKESHIQLQQVKRRSVHYEKQLGRLQTTTTTTTAAGTEGRGLGGASNKLTGGGSSNYKTVASSVKSSIVFDNTLTVDSLEELQTRLEIQIDENSALKCALESTMRAKEEDLILYHEMMKRTKEIFLQGLRQYRQTNNNPPPTTTATDDVMNSP